MALGWSLSWGLALGLVCFTLVGLRRGLTLRALVRMAWEGAVSYTHLTLPTNREV